MGYTTDFTGGLTLSRPATKQEKDYINLFSNTRRMKRNVEKLFEIYEGKHGYPFAKGNTPLEIYGEDGAYFAFNDGQCGQQDDGSIIDYNRPPGQPSYDETRGMPIDQILTNEKARKKSGKSQPGLWCQWVIEEPTEGEQYVAWDGGEKFYNYVEWLKYLIVHFFEPWGIKLNGEILWAGEDYDDRGKIVVVDNKITTKVGKLHYVDTDEDDE